MSNVDSAEYRRLLALGLGRATLRLKADGVEPYRAAILDACLHNLVYDPQIEEGRAGNLYEILRLTGAIDYFRSRILAALEVADDGYDLSQLFDLARLFALQGDEEARSAMYARFEANTRAGDDTGADQLIKLDGAAGLVLVAEHLGKMPRSDPIHWADNYLLSIAKEAGVPDPAQVLREASAQFPDILAFLARVEANEARRSQEGRELVDPATVSYDRIRAWIYDRERGRLRYSLLGWGKHASDADVLRAAQELLQEAEPKHLSRLLMIFARRPFPLGPGRLLALINLDAKPNGLKHRITHRALGALEKLSHPDVRAVALRLMERTDQYAGRSVGLLIRNYEPGDDARLEVVLSRLTDDEALHAFGFDILDLFQAHPDRESEVRMLLALYEKDPCSLCRAQFVDRLIALDALPAWMAEECRYDASDHIRQAVAARMPGGQVA